MGKTSRNKGKVGEREWASLCREQGYDCHRTAQYRGNTGAAGDVEGLPGIHIEVKRTEALRPWDYMEQAIRDAGEAGKGQLPIVAWRKNHYPWMVLMRAEDWFNLYKPWEVDRGQQDD